MIDFRQEIIRLPNSCIKCGYCLTKCKKDAIRATFSTVFAPPVI